MPRAVFVFGSNLAGRHGKGAALYAVQHHNATYGQGEGLQGDSYAIPTKDAQLRTLPLDAIKQHVETFLTFARQFNANFVVTRIGCGLAGYTDPQIAPMFADASANCMLPDGWRSRTFVVNVKTEPCDVRIDRTGQYGNRFVIGRDGNRATVIDKHMREWRSFLENPTTHAAAINCLHFMKGKRLGCHCAPQTCHGDNYVQLIAEYCP